MAEALEIQMARLQEQLKSVANTLAEDREIRKETNQEFSKRLTEIHDIQKSHDRRLESVEKELKEHSPTIKEFTRIKHQVHGAGTAGKWAWAIAIALIGFLYSSREAIVSFFTK